MKTSLLLSSLLSAGSLTASEVQQIETRLEFEAPEQIELTALLVFEDGWKSSLSYTLADTVALEEIAAEGTPLILGPDYSGGGHDCDGY
jgi:hypothetical protein